ncbi:MAG: type I-MYXAN CRISPR-associated protein Cas6/Cmx6, partial [Candidatus Binatia bacterium]
MPYVDLAFKLTGSKVPVDHGYVLYSAISRILPEIHGAKNIGVHPIRGTYSGNGELMLRDSSRLVIRLESERIGEFLKLAGKSLGIDSHTLRVGIPEVRPLRPRASLYSRLVTIKGFMEPASLLESAKRQLEKLGVSAEIQLGERRTLRVKDKQVVGFEVAAAGIDAEDSLRIQESGLGGRRHMGCGV